MADNVDREAFESMIEITDPFDVKGGIASWDIGTDPAKLNKRFEDKWIEENVVMGMAPDIATTPIATVKKAMAAVEGMAKYQRYIRFHELKKLAKIDFAGEIPKVAYKLKEEFHKLQKLVADDTIKAYEGLTDAEKAYSRSASPEQVKGLKDMVVQIGKKLVKAKQ